MAQVYTNSSLLTTANGLSDNRVTSIYKDKRGFVWIGTRNGLNLYDGRSFTIFRPSATNSISNEIINSITGDEQGNIWVGTMSGLNRYNIVTNTWTSWLPDRNNNTKNTIKNDIIWDVKFDQTGTLWIACDVQAFTSFQPSTEQFSFYEWPKLTAPNYHSIQAFTFKSGSASWLATNRGLMFFNPETRQFTNVGVPYYSDVIDLFYDSVNKQVFLSLEGDLQFVYHEITGKMETLTVIPEPYPSKHFLRTPEKEHWLACEKGLLHFPGNNGTAYYSKNIPQLSISLPPGGVLTTLQDADGIGWIGTTNGLFLVDRSAINHQFLPLLPKSNKEGSNTMTAVYYDESTDVYFVGSINPAAVFLVSGSTGMIKKITRDSRGMDLSGCMNIKKTNGEIWLVTINKLYRYDAQKGFVHFATPHDGVSTHYRSIEHGKGNELWITSFHNGVLIYDRKMKTFRHLSKPKAQHLRTAGMALAYDSIRESMWVATYGNYLYEYSYAADSLTGYVDHDSTPAYAPLSMVHDLYLAEDNTVWVATQAGGVFRYQPNQSYSKRFQGFSMRSGLQHNQFYSIKTAENGIVWLLSETGLSYLDSKLPAAEMVVKNLPPITSYGSDPRYPHVLAYNSKHNEVAVAAGGGLLIYYPNQTDRPNPFPILIGAPETNSRIYGWKALYYGNHPIRFEFRLDTTTNNWHSLQRNRQIHLDTLKPGSYDIQIRALDRKGIVISKSAPMSFQIQPPFWKTRVFLAGLIVLIGLISYIIIQSLKQKLKDEQILNQFATSLYGKSNLDAIFWDVAENCIRLLGFVDCVIYQVDVNRGVLVQKAAAGPKSPDTSHEILNQLEIPVGKGIVGSVGKTGKSERIGNTANDARYIVDDANRSAEITVPIIVNNQVFGVIDSEHPRRNFFTARHSRLLKRISAICAEKISIYQTEERLRHKISRDLHDEIGSTLTSINILSKVAMSKDEQQESIQPYLQKIKDHSAGMMESMSDMVWAINPINDSLDKVLIRMKEFAAEILEPIGIPYAFHLNGYGKPTILNLEERKDVFLIFKEAITNIAKYSAAKKVSISLQFDKRGFLLKIEDDGIGFDMAAAHSGNGIRNMQHRAEGIHAKIEIHSARQKGTSITLWKDIT